MTATATGYWAPKGGGPMEGALTTDDTDVATLAKSIETAHIRATIAPGALQAAGSTPMPFGAMTESVTGAGVYIAAPAVSGANNTLYVTRSGRYRFTLRTGYGSGSGTTDHIEINKIQYSGGATIDEPQFVGWQGTARNHATLTWEMQLAANYGFYVLNSGSASIRIEDISAQRIGD